MEIERKFLIQEGIKVYQSPFNDINELKKEIKKYGKNITQHYLPVEFLNDISKELGFEIKFKANELRIRKLGEKYSIAVKSKGKMKRSEFEKTISKDIFKTLEQLKEKTIKKIRLMKKMQDKIWFVDYFPKYSLTTVEVEFEDENEAEKFKTNMKEITGIKQYSNRVLAE